MNIFSTVVRLERDPEPPVGNRPLKLRCSEWLGAKKDDPHKCQFFDVVLWRQNIDYALDNYKQGDFLQVQGELRWKIYEGQNGKGVSVEMIFPRTRKVSEQTAKEYSRAEHSRLPEVSDTDIPF